MDTATYVNSELIPHSGGVMVTGLLHDEYGEYFKTEQFYGYSESESVELFIDRYGHKLVAL